VKRGFKTWCERQATGLRKEIGLQEHESLPAEMLADHLEIELVSPFELTSLSEKSLKRLVELDPGSWSASTISANGCSIIVYNPTHSPARHQANIMHELAHTICGHKPVRVGFVPWFPLPLREYRKESEEEAEWLGGCLQLPRVALEWSARHRMSHQQIANLFGASLEMVQYRWNKTGMERQFRRKTN
jgi:Zn-dependent peptidase ImmA (M78 family)